MIYQIVSVGIMVLFYGCYIIKMLNQKRKGIQTDQLGRNKSGLVKIVESAVKICAYAVLLTELISIWQNVSFFSSGIRTFGAVLACFGVLFFVAAVLTMRDSWRAGVSENEETELVTFGIYRISRNPAFLGFDLLHIGIFLMFANGILFFVSFFTVLMFHLQITKVEEKFLTAVFGDVYVNYCGSVNRYFGRKFLKK